MKSALFLLLSSGALAVSAVTPRISDVQYAQDQSRMVTVSYALADADAIVTADVLTNGVSIGLEYLTNAVGDVNAKVAADGSRHAFTWRPDKSWPDRKFTQGEVDVVVRAWATNSPPDYLVCDTATGACRYYVSTNALPGGVDSDVYRTSKLLLRRIPGGRRFMMGSNVRERGRNNSRGETPHLVTISRDFWLGVFPVTQRQWANATGKWPSHWNNAAYRETRPVENITWTDIKGTAADWPAGDQTTFLAKLRTQTGLPFDLPTEAQWEYACRAGTYTALYTGFDLIGTGTSTNLDAIARYKRNGGKKSDGNDWSKDCDTSCATPRVGSYAPNAWGLYDMLGCTYEWVNDWYGAYDLTVEIDPRGPSSNSEGKHVLRGGGWHADASSCRAAQRHYEKITHYGFGCRVMLP